MVLVDHIILLPDIWFLLLLLGLLDGLAKLELPLRRVANWLTEASLGRLLLGVRVVTLVLQVVLADFHEEPEASALFLGLQSARAAGIAFALGEELLVELLDDFVFGLALDLRESGRLALVGCALLVKVDVFVLGQRLLTAKLFFSGRALDLLLLFESLNDNIEIDYTVDHPVLGVRRLAID